MADDDAKPSLPFAVYLVIGVLAVIGAFSISGFVLDTIYLFFRIAFVVFVVLIVASVLRAVFKHQAASN